MYVKTKQARNYTYLHIKKISTPPNIFLVENYLTPPHILPILISWGAIVIAVIPYD